jgi:nicotinate-nucleotide--dimethylbenzimidazole phosphoribosyltransferase
MTPLRDAIAAVEPLGGEAMAAARDRLDHLTKPPGSLGRLEELVVWLAGVTATPAPPVGRRRIVVAAADHGVAMLGQVSAWPSDVTAQMVATFLAGRAAISTLAAAGGASVEVLDVGVASPIPPAAGNLAGTGGGARLVSRPVRKGTSDLTVGPAMSRAEAEAAIAVGLDAVDRALAEGIELLGVGEMGIGNTTAAAAVAATLYDEPGAQWCGRGTGLAPHSPLPAAAPVHQRAGGAPAGPGADAEWRPSRMSEPAYRRR